MALSPLVHWNPSAQLVIESGHEDHSLHPCFYRLGYCLSCMLHDGPMIHKCNRWSVFGYLAMYFRRVEVGHSALSEIVDVLFIYSLYRSILGLTMGI